MSWYAFGGAVSLTAIAAGAGTLLLLRCWRVSESTAVSGANSLPVPMRVVRPLAVMLEPLLANLLSGHRLAFLARELDALGLGNVSPLRWEASRVAAALLAGGVAAMASGSFALSAMILAVGAYLASGIWLKRRREALQKSMTRELPAWLDLMTVCVEAGATLTSGLRLIVSQAPHGPLREYFERVLREVRSGRARSQAFSYVAEIYAVESLTTLASALAHAEGSGMSLGQVLRTQAEQRTAERFARAEKLAMQAPVKMLGPLILCIFPCTFIVIAVPIAVRLGEAFGS